MGTGFSGTYVLTIDQTSLDGASATTELRPRIGQVWRRQGEAVRLDGPQSTLLLQASVGHDALRARVASVVNRRFDLPEVSTGPAHTPAQISNGFVVSDGEARFTLVPIDAGAMGVSLLWCAEGVPLPDHDYTVIAVPEEQIITHRNTDFGGDVICFTAGTRIRTQEGHKLVETLRPGDHVQTKDNGCQEILWIGSRRMTGARLHAMPELRPVRIMAQALQDGVPDDHLVVSPHHKMLYEGPNAQALFNAPEVLIAARDMINDHSIFFDHSVRDVTYIHLLFADHQIVWANNVPTESFHPANTTLQTIATEQRQDLLGLFPDLEADLHSYGPHARRNLAKPEAAILLHDRL